MALFKCKMCGGALEVSDGATIIECGYCGTKQTLPKLNDEKRANLYERANHFRRNNEFDKAMGIYEQILNEDNTDAEAYWSIVLCRYGIEYVEDPSSHRRVPTVNRVQFTSILADEDYKSAIKNADTYQKSIYEIEAKAIDKIQKEILAISNKEDPFDVFICYKETDNNGQRTHDSVLAQDLYYQLKQEGFKVFFSRITLESKLGSAYEPYIFAALNSAKVMVVLGTKPEYFNAVWVKNEWSRYLALIKQGQKKMLIPAYKDMDPYDLPEEFSHLQAQDMSKLGFMQDLLRGIKKIVKPEKTPATVVKETVVTTTANTNIAPLLKRAFMFLEDGDWDSADEYAEKVLDINPECSDAYIVKLLIDLELKSSSKISSYSDPIDKNPNYIKALRFAQGDERAKIENYNKTIVERLENNRKSDIYNQGCRHMTSQEYRDAIACFSRIPDFKDSSERINICKERVEIARKQRIYNAAMDAVALASSDDKAIKNSISSLKTISGFKDADAQVEKLQVRLDKWYEDKKAADEKARIKAEQEKMEKARLEELRRIKAAENKRKAKRMAKRLLIIALVACVLAILIIKVFIPLYMMNKADNLFEQGEYDEANQIYFGLSGFGKSEQRIQTILAIDLLGKQKYDRAINTLLHNDIPVEIKYNFNGATSHSKDNEAVLLSSASEFKGLVTPQKNGYEFVAWKFDGFAYDVNDKAGNFTVTLSAVWKQLEYNIIYDLDGGVINGNNPTKYNINTDSFTLINPTKTGYTFAGWFGTNTSEPTTEVTVNKGSYGNREYKAIWDTNWVKISFDANGGNCSKDSIIVYYDETLSLPTPTWEGHTFAGWFNGSQRVYNGTVCKLTKDIVLTAKWDSIEYSITYDLGGGVNSQSNPSSYITEEEIVLQNPTRVGYTFLGWTYSGQTTPVKNVTIAVGTIGNKSYKANWQANTYTISFDANGGTGVSATQTVTYNSTYTLPTPTRTGYTFNGWYNGGTKVESGTWTNTSNLQITASWTANTYTLTLDANGGTGVNNTQTVTYDDAYTLPTPTRTGYTFNGWYSGNTKVESGTWTSTSDLTITASWTANTYTLTFDANCGTGVNASQTVTYDAAYTLPTPTRTGYTFNGWYNGNTKVESGTWNNTSNVTLTAQWTAISYTITYDDVSIETDEITVTLDYNYSGAEASTVTLTNGEVLTYPDIPIREGYAFAGWYTDSACTVNYTFSGTITEDITLYAKWVSMKSNYTSREYVDIANYNSYSSTKSITVSASYSSSPNYYYFTCYQTGTYTFYSAYTSGDFYINVYNATNGSLVMSDNLYSYNTSKSISFAADAGDVIYVSLYKYSSSSSTGKGTFYVTNASYPTSTATASCSTVEGFVYDDSSNYSTMVTFDETYNLLTPTRTGYTFGGWYNGDTLVESGTWNYTTDLTLTANWISNTYTVTLDANGGTGVDATQTVTYDAAYTLPTPTRTGYIFDGWFCGTTQYSGGTWTTADNVALVAQWTPRTDISYVVNHYKQNLQDEEFTLVDTEYLCGVADSTITPQVYTYAGFTSPTATTTTISPDGSRVVNYYYTRNEYTITLITNGGTTDQKERTFKYQETIDANNWTAREGYTFGGWFTDVNLETAFTANAMPAQNVTIYAYWSEEDKPSSFTYIDSGADIRIIAGPTGKSTIVIPKYINGKFVTCIYEEAFKDCTSLTSIIIPDSIVSIGDYAFSGCTSLESITIPNLVTSIGYYAFEDCTSLTSITIPDSVTSIGEGAFSGCSSLERITLPFVGSSASSTTASSSTLFGYIFGRTEYTGGKQTTQYYSTSYSYYYTSYIPTTLKSVTITGGEILYGAFYNCSMFTSITIPETVTSIAQGTFYNCTGLTSITIPKDVTSIGSSAFYNCSSIEDVYYEGDIEGWCSIDFDGQYSTPMCYGDNFYIDNETVTELVIPDTITAIDSWTFSNWKTLTSVSVPSSVTSIGASAFSGCTSLESMTLPFVGSSASATTASSSTLFGYIFGTSSYTGGTQTSQRYPSGSYAYDATYYIPTTLKSVTITGGEILYGAFYNCSTLTSITIPDSLTSIGNYAFYRCSALTSITIPKGVTSIGSSAFYNCSSLADVYYNGTVEDWCKIDFNGQSSNPMNYGDNLYIDSKVVTELVIPDTITKIDDWAFYNWKTLTSVSVPSSVTSIGSNAFSGCSSLESMTLPFVGSSSSATTASGATLFGYIFGTASYTGGTQTTQRYPSGSYTYDVTYYIPTSLKTVTITGGNILYGAFYNCSMLTSVTLAKGVTSIGDRAFYNCMSLSSVTISDGVDSLGTYAFYNCDMLEKVIIPGSVGSIGANAFQDCIWLENVIISEGVTSIGTSAFSGCKALTDISIPNSMTSIGANAFSGCTALSYTEYKNGCYLGNDTNPYHVLVKIKDKTATSFEMANTTKYIYTAALKGSSITSITIPDSVVSIGYEAFMNCASLESVTIGNGVTSIAGYSFCNCYALKTVTMGKNVVTIGTYAFEDCKVLENITLGDKVTTIEGAAFYGCLQLSSINIPASITSIGSHAFYNCNKLTSATFGKATGWSAGTTNMSESKLSNPADAASLLRLYYSSVWKNE